MGDGLRIDSHDIKFRLRIQMEGFGHYVRLDKFFCSATELALPNRLSHSEMSE